MTPPHYQDDAVTILHGDCLDVLATLPDSSVHAVVTDPPYGLSFMGKDWDRPTPRTAIAVCVECGNDAPVEGYTVCADCLTSLGTDGNDYAIGAEGDSPEMVGQMTQNWHGKGAHTRGYAENNNQAFGAWCAQWAAECLRVLKPGGHLVAFGGTRTWHRLAVAVEDSGFEIRDSIAWLYSSGFPKSLDVSKAIDAAKGAVREQGDLQRTKGSRNPGFSGETYTETPDYSVALYRTRPALVRAAEWEGWGTGLKPAFEPIVIGRKPLIGTVTANVLTHDTGALNIDACRVPTTDAERLTMATGAAAWTAHGERVGRTRPDGSTAKPSDIYSTFGNHATLPHDAGRWPPNVVLDDPEAAELDRQAGGVTGGASRFFPIFRYEAKAPPSQRPRVNGTFHPTVKPLDLMRWLVRLVTPPGGTVLDPFGGSGTTAEACIIEGARCITIERESDYLPLIQARITKPIQPALDLFGDDGL